METFMKLTTAYRRLKNMIKTHAMTIGLIALLLYTFNQEGISQIRPKSIRVSLYNEATTLPDGGIFHTPLHPGITVGADLLTGSGKHWQKSLGADLTFYYHELSENALILDAVYTLGYRFGFGLQLKLITAAGYKHSFLPGDVYRFEDGQYRKVKDWGMSHFNLKLGLGLEFPINEKISLTADQKLMVALPYSESLPFSLHSFRGIGVKINLQYNKSK